MNSSLSALWLTSNKLSSSSVSSESLLWSWGGSSATSCCHTFPVHLLDSPVTLHLSVDRHCGTCSHVLGGIYSTLLSSITVPITSWMLCVSSLPSKFPYCPCITSQCSSLLFHILMLTAISHVFACCHMLGHISLYDAIDWFFSNATTVFQNTSKISYWSCIDTLYKPASMSTAQFPIQYLGNTVLKHVLHKNCCRSNRLLLTIYVIVFLCRFFSCTGSSKKCNIYTLLSFSQFTKRTWTRYLLSMVFLVTVIVKV